MDRKLNTKWTELLQLWNMVSFLPYTSFLSFDVQSVFVLRISLSVSQPHVPHSPIAPSGKEAVRVPSIQTSRVAIWERFVCSGTGTGLFSLSNTVNWIESFEFLRFPEVRLLWARFGFKDNRVRFFFLSWQFKKTRLKPFGGDVFSLQRNFFFNVIYKRKRQSS